MKSNKIYIFSSFFVLFHKNNNVFIRYRYNLNAGESMGQNQLETVSSVENGEEKKIIVRTYMGRPSKLHENQMSALRISIENKKVCTVHEIQEYIREEFNVTYSSKEVREILRKFNLTYYPLLRKYTYPSYYNEKIIKKFDF